jgi:hypothetical protein
MTDGIENIESRDFPGIPDTSSKVTEALQAEFEAAFRQRIIEREFAGLTYSERIQARAWALWAFWRWRGK